MHYPKRPCLILLAVCCLSQTGEGSMDSEAEAGRAEAKKDLSAGVLKYRQPIPEVFLLECMEPGSEDEHLLEYYAALLDDRHGIKHQWVMFNAASPAVRARAASYNQEMKPTIEKRFGTDILDKTWKEACKVSDAKRVEYLAARRQRAQRGQGAATRPTTRNAGPTSRDRK
jgi:hypothetical protein